MCFRSGTPWSYYLTHIVSCVCLLEWIRLFSVETYNLHFWDMSCLRLDCGELFDTKLPAADGSVELFCKPAGHSQGGYQNMIISWCIFFVVKQHTCTNTNVHVSICQFMYMHSRGFLHVCICEFFYTPQEKLLRRKMWFKKIMPNFSQEEVWGMLRLSLKLWSHCVTIKNTRTCHVRHTQHHIPALGERKWPFVDWSQICSRARKICCVMLVHGWCPAQWLSLRGVGGNCCN